MKYLSALALAVLLFALPAFSQQSWQRTYGGTSRDYGFSVRQTTDLGYIVAGYTLSFGNAWQVYVVKTDSSGDTLWTRTYGGTGWDYGYSVEQTTEGGYIVAGYTSSFGNGFQVYLIKTNASGDTLWTRTYGGTNNEYCYSVQQTRDGGYIVVGTTYSFGDSFQVYLIKTNALGDTLWTKTYGGAGYDEGRSVQQTQDGGYIVTGYSTSFGNGWQVNLIKTNVTGDTLWTRNYGGASYECGYSVRQTTDGGYIVAGHTSSFGNGWQVYLIKTNITGDTLWTRIYGGVGTDNGSSIKQTTDGGYIIAGYIYSVGYGEQVYLIKVNALGDSLWTRTYGGAGDDYGFSVQQTTDGGYVIAGSRSSYPDTSQVYLIKTDANGNVGVETPVRPLDGLTVGRLRITPNPFVSFATVQGHEAERFSLYDISGRRLGVFRGDRIGEGLSPGVYFLRPSDGPATPLRLVKIR